MMQAIGDAGLVTAGAGILVFTGLYLSSTRWWTDHLGRAIAAFCGSIAIIMGLVIWRILGLPLAHVQVWRAVLFGAMAASVWAGVVGFVWAQFIRHRVRSGRTTPNKRGPHGMNPPKAPFWFALAGLIVMAVLTGIQSAFADARIDAVEGSQIAVQLVMAVNVYLAANLPQYKNVKRYVAALITGLQLFVTLVPGGVDTSEWINLAITVLAALGVVFSPQPLTRTVDGETRTYRADDGPPRNLTTR